MNIKTKTTKQEIQDSLTFLEIASCKQLSGHINQAMYSKAKERFLENNPTATSEEIENENKRLADLWNI